MGLISRKIILGREPALVGTLTLCNGLLIVLFSLIAGSISGQQSNLSTPIVRGFPKNVYGGGTQNWGFVQDQSGIIYVANNEGLLSFDAETWRLFPLPNHTIVRSVALGPDGIIYAGGQDEFGFFKADQVGNLSFISLKQKIPAAVAQFEDVWNIIVDTSGVFFRASDRIYHYVGDSIRVCMDDGPLTFLGTANGNVLTHHVEHGLMRYAEGSFSKYLNTTDEKWTGVTAILPVKKDKFLVCTEKQGIYMIRDRNASQWTPEHAQYLTANQIQTAFVMPDGNIAFGTVFGGLLITDVMGRSLYVIRKEQGLQTNHVRSVFADREQNLWLGLDNGVDYVLASSPFRLLIPDPQLEGTAYAAGIFRDEIYLGTSNGLYKAPWMRHYNPFHTAHRFTLVPGTLGQVWGIDQIGETLFLGHHNGAFWINGNAATQISDISGYWKFVAPDKNTDRVVAGTYHGLRTLRRTPGGEWIPGTRYSGITESARIMTHSSDGSIWFSHPYRGIYQIRQGADSSSIAEFYGSEKGLPSDQNNFVTSIYGEILACTQRGIYVYQPLTDKFAPHPVLADILGNDVQVRYLREDPEGNLWYVLNDEVGILNIAEKGLTKEIIREPKPELRDKLVGGFESVFPIDANHVLFGTDKGFLDYDPQRDPHDRKKFHTIVSRVYVTASSDSLIYGGFPMPAGQKSSIPAFANRINAFRFHFAATWFEHLTPIEYQCMLEGLDPDWLDWTSTPFREYTNLPHGEYTFQVRARISPEHIGETASFAFVIRPPWYRTAWAYFGYTLLGFGILSLIIVIPRYKFRQEKAQMQREHERKEETHLMVVQQSEEEIMRLKNEKLEADVRHKNHELASSTMHLVQKNALLTEISAALRKILNRTSEPEVKKELSKLVHLVDHDNQMDEDWDHFTLYFDQVHGDFFKKLKDHYPELTTRDHKLCAYLRLNLSSKEIAPLMNISIRGVELSRYRLRKKLGLDTSVNLNEFLMHFGEKPPTTDRFDEAIHSSPQ